MSKGSRLGEGWGTWDGAQVGVIEKEEGGGNCCEEEVHPFIPVAGRSAVSRPGGCAARTAHARRRANGPVARVRSMLSVTAASLPTPLERAAQGQCARGGRRARD